MNSHKSLDHYFFIKASFILAFLLFSRLFANYFIPLNDTTEARYGEIARKMLETGNWVNLLHDYGVPFWAKPPLSTWCTALTMKFLGVNEFAARLPSLFCAIAILGLIGHIARKHSGPHTAVLSVLILSGTLFFFLGSGTVMTDMVLIFCTTLSSVAFWHALVRQSTFWSYLVFLGLGLGLLAKGPLAIVLVAIPIFFWVLVQRQWRHLWERLPWVTGTLLMLFIALPWYILAERRTPGFLNYFIVGEHFNRFLVPGWTGDRYGMAHYAPKGMIWLFAFVGVFPWSFLGIKWCCTHWKKLPFLFRADGDGWLLYWALCMLAPLVFFTFAGNIIYPYVFPVLPAFALLFAELCDRFNPSFIKSQSVFILTSLSGVIFLIATILFIFIPNQIAKTEKPVVQAWLKQSPALGSNLIYWAPKTEFSAQFYSFGVVKSAKTLEALCNLLSNDRENYIVLPEKSLSELPKDLLSQFKLTKTITQRKEHFILFHSPVLHC